MKPDDELLEITDDMLARAELRVGERVIRRGRPPSAAPKQATKLRPRSRDAGVFPQQRPRLADPHQCDAAPRR